MVFYYTYYSDDFLEALTVSSAIFGFRGGNQSVLPGERLVKKGGKVTDNFDWSDSTNSREVVKGEGGTRKMSTIIVSKNNGVQVEPTVC